MDVITNSVGKLKMRAGERHRTLGYISMKALRDARIDFWFTHRRRPIDLFGDIIVAKLCKELNVYKH